MVNKLLFFLVLLAVGACAIISSPTGGEKDETPPEIINTMPQNQSTMFNATEIEIWFDEYIELKNFNTQFYSSPPLEKQVVPKLKGKKLTLFLEEELKPNTTYTFSFGNCLQDITEGNIQGNFKYVFSTGENLDSLSIAGMVVDAYTGLPIEGLITVLYPTGIPDSTLLKERPLYYSVTNENGLFSLEHLPDQEFQLFAIKDENLNLRYDEGAEQYGFISDPVASLDSSLHEIRAYKDRRTFSLQGSKYSGYGQVILGFGQPVKNLNVEVITGVNMPETNTPTFTEFERDRDTAYFYFNRDAYPEELNFLYLNIKFDEKEEDSVRLSMTTFKQPTPGLSFVEAASLSPKDSLKLECNIPVTAIDESLITTTLNGDTVAHGIEQIGLRFMHLKLKPKYEDKLSCTFLPGALGTQYGPNEDTIVVRAKMAREEDLATVFMKLSSAENTPKIYQLFEAKGRKIIAENGFTTGVDLTMTDLVPKKYGIRIIWDDNGNGRWDVGEFATRKQPEQIRYYPNEIELRANWELEIEWVIPTLKK